MTIELDKVATDKLGFFRFKELNGKYLLTNEVGGFISLSNRQFNKFVYGNIDRGDESYDMLSNRNFIRNRGQEASLIDAYRARNSFLWGGPSLHIIAVTLRCNQTCLYCQSLAKPMDEPGLDMSKDTARKTVDIIFDSPARNIKIEFQGGEPLANWDCVKFIVEYANKKNIKHKKNIAFSLVTNLALMSSEKLKYLFKNKVYICTSLDGPRFLHDRNRVLLGEKQKSHSLVNKWLKIINTKYGQNGCGALVTVSRFSLSYPKEIIDEYIRLGLKNIHLRPVSNLGKSKNLKDKVGYSAEEFVKFYKKALDYLLELNISNKTSMPERTAVIFLSKILRNCNTDYLDLRSPCGAGIGQVLYNYDGKVYTCDEARMLGHDVFLVGNVKKDGYREIIGSAVTKACCFASCLDGLYCDYCAYKPFCGVCPVYNYEDGGNIFGQMPNVYRCSINKQLLDYLFIKLEDRKVHNIFEHWLGGGIYG